MKSWCMNITRGQGGNKQKPQTESCVFIPMKLFSLSPYFLILLTPAGSSPAGRDRGRRRQEHPRGAPRLESGLRKTPQQEGISLYLCRHPPPEPSEVLQVHAVLNPNPYTEPGQLLLSHVRHGQTLASRPRRAAAPALHTVRGSHSTERPARPEHGGWLYPQPGCTPRKARRGQRGRGSVQRRARAMPEGLSVLPVRDRAGLLDPQTPGPGREAALLPIPTSALPRAGRGQDPARVRRRPRPQPRSAPSCSYS